MKCKEIPFCKINLNLTKGDYFDILTENNEPLFLPIKLLAKFVRS